MAQKSKILKILAFGDLHIHNYRHFDNDGSRLKDTLKALELAYELASNHECDYICFTGDLFDSAKVVPTVVLNATLDTWYNIPEYKKRIPFITVSGNHDYATKPTLEKNAETSQELITRISNVYLLDNKQLSVENEYLRHNNKIASYYFRESDVYGVPFYYDEKDYLTKVNSIIVDESKFNILVTHVTLSDYFGFEGRVSSMDTCYDKFDLVLCGDIHKYGLFGSKRHVLMTGNPLHRNLTDVGDDKYMHVITCYNDKTFEFDMINTGVMFPRFIKVKDVNNLPDGYSVEKDYVIIDKSEAKAVTINESITIDVNTSKSEMVTAFCEHTLGRKDDSILTTGLGILKELGE